MKIKLSEIRAKAVSRPSDYYDTVISKGRIVGDVLEITPEAYRDLVNKYSSPNTKLVQKGCCGKSNAAILESTASFPPITEQLRNVSSALKNAAKSIVAGNKLIVSDEILSSRQQICEKCEFWVGSSRRCLKCGCKTDLKLKLSTESCPIGKWVKV